MDKKEYIVNQLKRTYGKKYENYCITRIINKLDNLNVQFVTQQLFQRSDGKYAYADLFFPQLNISIEIDESHHLNQNEEDAQRTKDIIETDKKIRERYTGLEDIILDPIEEYRISANYMNTIEEINENIDNIVKILQQKISKMGNNFIPWKSVYDDASYFLDRGYIDKCDNAKFQTIDDIGKLFNINKVPMGYKIHGYVPILNNSEYIWCPILKLSDNEKILNNAENTISNKGKYIFEYFKKNNDKEVKKELNKNTKRYVFVKYKDEIGNISYKFIGIYILDKEKTLKENIRVWKRVETRINFV